MSLRSVLLLPWLCCVALGIGESHAAQRQASAKQAIFARTCADHIAQAERAARIPQGLMQAIAVVESGRKLPDSKARTAWPWTIHAQGRGRYFKSKRAAVAAVRKLQADGVSNIDIGCMQVNMHYHGEHFGSVEDAFDPARNAAYAAQFLNELQRSRGSWSEAVAYYHSGRPKLNRPYREKVYAVWRDRGATTTQTASAQPAVRTTLRRPVRLGQQRRMVGMRSLRTQARRNLGAIGAHPSRALAIGYRSAKQRMRAGAVPLKKKKGLRKYWQRGSQPKTYRLPSKR